VWALLGDGQISMLPRGVDEYLERRAADLHLASVGPAPVLDEAPSTLKAKSGSAAERTARKTLARLDKQIARLAAREAELHAALTDGAADYELLAGLGVELDGVLAEKETLELEWLEAADVVE
jgi:ATP-binding cassette subfamily F protein uup